MQLALRSQAAIRSRAAVLLALAAAAGAFGAAAMMSTATAPTARADDFSTIVADVESDLTEGQMVFSQAAVDFDDGGVISGLQGLIAGAYDDLVGVPDNLYVGTVEALTNEPVLGPGSFDFNLLASTPEFSDFSEAVTEAQSSFSVGAATFATAATDFSAGDYGGAAYNDALGSIYSFYAPADYLLLGGLEALGIPD